MEKKKKILLGAGGGIALLAATAAVAAGLGMGCEPRGVAAADLNKDGQVSAAEVEQSGKQRFASFDANKDGKLTGDEMPRDRGDGGRHGRGGEDDMPQAYQVVPAAAVTAQPGAPAHPGAAAQQPAVPQQVMLVPVRSEQPRMDANGDGAVTIAEFLPGHRQRLTRADANGDGALSAE